MRHRLLVGLLITLFCAVAGAGVAWWASSPRIPAEAEVTERARAAAAGLRDSHVYVDPSSEGVFTEQQLSDLDAAAAATDPQVFLVVWPDSSQAGYAYSSDVLKQIGRLTDRPGHYVEVSPGDRVSDTEVGMTGGSFSAFGGSTDTWTSAEQTDQLLEAIKNADGHPYELGEDTGSQYFGGTAGTIAAGLLIGVLNGVAVALLILGGWFAIRRRRAR